MPSPAATRTIHLIGIGAGSPEFLTQQAIAAINEVDVFLAADKGAAKDDLVGVRTMILDRFVRPGRSPRFVTVPDPARGPDAARGDTAYEKGVRDWHAERARRYAQVIAGLPSDATVGFLVWGDPAFYDSTIRVVEAIGELMPVRVSVVPGISAFQALAAAHGVVLHDVGRPVHVTTGRRLVGEVEAAHQAGIDLGTVVVMLDGHLACRELVHTAPDLVLRWGAYVGMPQQQLRAGRLADIIDEVVALRAALRAEHGWVMDVYALSDR